MLLPKQTFGKAYELTEEQIAEGWTLEGHELIGSLLVRRFAGVEKMVHGTVVAGLPPSASGDKVWYFFCVHEDGDSEELEADEVRESVALREKNVSVPVASGCVRASCC